MSKRGVVALPYMKALLPVVLDAADLVHPDRRLQVHHVVFESDFDHLVMLVAFVGKALPRVLRHSVEREHLDSFRDPRVVRQYHAALAGDNILRRVKTKDSAVAEGARLPAAILRLDGVRAVLD